MKILENAGICTCCGNFAEYQYGDENFSLMEKNLENYQNYKDVYVYQCPKCGFISTDITGLEGVVFGNVKNSLEFQNALSYSYLKGLDTELYDNHSLEIPANLYDAYSLVCLANKDYEKLVRTLNKAVELKQIMAQRYRYSQDELGGEENNDADYDKLNALIEDNIAFNRMQIDFYFSKIEHKNEFLILLYIENLVALGQKEKARKVFDTLSKSVLLKNDLQKYMLGLLE